MCGLVPSCRGEDGLPGLNHGKLFLIFSDFPDKAEPGPAQGFISGVAGAAKRVELMQAGITGHHSQALPHTQSAGSLSLAWPNTNLSIQPLALGAGALGQVPLPKGEG